MQETLLVAALILAVIWLVLRIRRNKLEIAAESRPTKTSTGGAFHAVAISYSESACDAAKAMTGRRFLSSAAPRLPLPECDALECRCQFTHHDDRRTGQDRRSPFSPGNYGGGTGTYERERRDRKDRRKSTGGQS
ncbi:MAG: hypothetical protein K0U72_05460 [Gammaproteobacteria bacterium]|nr:hypothetical protein [Gammaproteobacteria bacterium]